MAVATGVGSWPGTSLPRALAEIETALGQVPFLPELPARGPQAAMLGRTLGLLAGDAGGDLLRADLAAWARWVSDVRRPRDHLPSVAPTLALVGPATLAGATDRAPDGLVGPLSEAAVELVASARAGGVGPSITVQLDEPLLAHAADADLAATAEVAARLAAAGIESMVHTCARPVPWDRLARLGLPAHVDVSDLPTTVAPLPAGSRLGVVPTSGPWDEAAIDAWLRDRVPPAERGTAVVGPACGLGLSPDAGARLAAVGRVASRLP